MRSNPVPGEQHTSHVLRPHVTYVSHNTTSTLDCFAAYQWYVSRVRWRLRKDGLGKAQPCPGALRRDGGRGYVRARRGEPPRRYAAPLPRGEFTGEASAIPQPPSKPPSYSPLGRGAARRRRGGFPRRTQPTSKPPSLISDIC
ncbi:MAG: hypothetical protein LBM98_02290 [Oscillospiraceae bacterium]|nr:hypothetical protein [Oscillospiraceae bacterium]